MSNKDSASHPTSIFKRFGSTAPRRIILLALLVAGVYLLIPQLVGVGGALRLIGQARMLPLLAAISFQVGSILSQTYVLHQMLLTLGPHMSFFKLLQITLASGLATLLIPSAGVSGMVVRARYLTEFSYTADATVFACVLEGLGLGVAQCIILSLALIRHALGGQAVPWQPLALLVSMVLLGGAALAALLSRPHKRNWRYALLERVNSIRIRRGRPPLRASALEQRLSALRQVLLTLRRPSGFRLLLGNLGRVVGAVLCLYVTLRAFGQAMPLPSVAIAFSLSDVLGGMSTIPGGLIVTETSLVALLTNAGVPLSVAMAATLTFRLITLWLPRAVGAIAWYGLQRRSSRPFW